jgi:O-antigen ligase
LFANRNHNGVLSAVSLLIVLWYLSDRTDQFPPLRYAVWIAMALFLLAGIMVNGSRAGLLCTLLALGLVAIARLSRPSQEGETSISAARRIAPIVLGTGVVLGTIALFVAGDRSTAAARLFGEDPTQGMRWESATTSLALAWDNLIFGVGFGAFESAYRMVEPRELLNPYYLNEAHNDWLQFVIEGGLSGLLVLVLGGAMVAHGLATKRHEDDRIVLAFLIFIILAAASIVDYPLRTPLMMIIAAWIAFAFGRKSSTANRN